MSCTVHKQTPLSRFPDMSKGKVEEEDAQYSEMSTHPSDGAQGTGPVVAVPVNPTDQAVPIPATHVPAVYYSPPGSPLPHIPIYMGGMMHYYHPAGSPPPPGLYPLYLPHPSVGIAQGSPSMYHQYYHDHMPDLQMPDSSFQRTHSSGSAVSVDGSSPTKRSGEGRATGRISRSSRTMSATQLLDDLNFDPEASVESLTRTTLMMKNLPNKYQAADVMKLINSVGLEGSFDFLYVPLDFRNSANLGYAFINMVEPKDTQRLYDAFAGKRWDEKGSKKVCEIRWARLQGRERLVDHFKEAKFPSQERRFLPLVWRRRKTVSGRDVVDGEPLTIFEFVDSVPQRQE